jgi:hypothetical protein
MPNIIIELQREISRVEAGLEKLDATKRSSAETTLGFARLAMKGGFIEDFYQAVNDLKEIEIP